GAEEYLWEFGFHDRQAFLEANMVPSTGMIRRAAYDTAGGNDEEMRHGLEDWDFWLRAAHRGLWGATLPEYLSWYRRRERHSDRWRDWAPEGEGRFRDQLKTRYPGLWNGRFPDIHLRPHLQGDGARHELPCDNRLRKEKPRLLLIV